MSELSESIGDCEGCGEFYADCKCDSDNAEYVVGEILGCCMPVDCVMPGTHFPTECHSSQMVDDYNREHLFTKFAWLYAKKYGRTPSMTDKYDKSNFEMFEMGWNAHYD